MRKSNFGLATAFLVIAACVGLCVPRHALSDPSDAPKDVDTRLHKECLYPIVQLLEVGKQSGATGFVVRSEKLRDNVYYNMFLTCAHCVDDKPQEVALFLYEDWSYVRKIVKFPCLFYGVEDSLDVAVGYFLSDQLVPTTKLSPDLKLFIGSAVSKIGCGIGQEPRIDFGKVTRPVRRNEVKQKYLRHSAMTVPGDSGSPVFHDYKVVGMTTHISATRNVPVFHLSFCLPIGRIYDWSKANGGFYDHVFEPTTKMPKMPQYRLEVSNDYEIAK